jgi:hypothetical protein
MISSSAREPASGAWPLPALGPAGPRSLALGRRSAGAARRPSGQEGGGSRSQPGRLWLRPRSRGRIRQASQGGCGRSGPPRRSGVPARDARANGPQGCSAGRLAGRPSGPGASLRATGQRGRDGCPPVMGRSSAALDESQGANIYSNQDACRDGPAGQTPLADHPGWRRSGSRLVPRHDYAGPERPVPRVPVRSRQPAGCAGGRPGVTIGRRAER